MSKTQWVIRHQEKSDWRMLIQIEDRQEIISLVGEKRAMVLRTDRHILVALATSDGIAPNPFDPARIDHGKNVSSKIHIHLASHRIIRCHATLAVEAKVF